MARVTVEKALDKIENKFELIILASYRAHSIASRSVGHSYENNDKPTIAALRELENDKVNISLLREAIVNQYADENQTSDVINIITDDFGFEDLFENDKKVEKNRNETVRLGDVEVDTSFFE